ncbi:UNVERIFIED_CONTAM: hypothetical protein NCL1_25300 [Trichonephila clavipes]
MQDLDDQQPSEKDIIQPETSTFNDNENEKIDFRKEAVNFFIKLRKLETAILTILSWTKKLAHQEEVVRMKRIFTYVMTTLI